MIVGQIERLDRGWVASHAIAFKIRSGEEEGIHTYALFDNRCCGALAAYKEEIVGVKRAFE